MDTSRLEKLQNLTELQPENAFAWYGLAMEYRSLGKFEEAARTFADLRKRHPDYTALFLQYGFTLAQLGEIDRARSIFEEGIAACGRKGEEHAVEELRGAIEDLG